MRWYVSVRGQSYGPLEEAQVIQAVTSGAEHVQGESGGPWLPIHQSPFAPYAPQPALQQGVGVQGHRSSQGKPSSVTAMQVVFMVLVLVLAAVSAASGWFGILLGSSLIGWTLYQHKRGRKSLLAIIWNKPKGVGLAAASICLGLLFTMCGAGKLSTDAQVERKKLAALQAEQQKAAADAKARAELTAAVPQKVAAWRAKLGDAHKRAAEDVADARRQTEMVIGEIEVLKKGIGGRPPELLSQVGAETESQADSLRARAELLEDVNLVGSRLLTGKGASSKGQWIAADDAYVAAEGALSRIDAAKPELKAFIPPTFDVAKHRGELARLRRAIAGPVASERKRIAREEAKRKAEEEKAAAYAALCGPEPVRSQWDGEIVGLEAVIQRTAHDPDSIDVENCTPPQLSGQVCWIFSCDVRGKNAFGAKVFARKRYSHSKALGFQELTE